MDALTLAVTFCFFVAAALLWLAAEIGAAAFGRTRALGQVLVLCSLVLGAAGLWWPAQALRVHEAIGAEGPWTAWIAWLPALTLALLGCGIGMLWRRALWAGAVALMVAMPLACYAYAMFAAPGMFRTNAGPGWIGPGTFIAALAVALIVARIEAFGPRQTAAMRGAACVLAAAAAALGAAASMPDGKTPELSGKEMPVMLAFLVLGLLLHRVQRYADNAAPVPRLRRRSSSIDALTGLATRLQFEQRLHAAAKKSAADRSALAVLFVDLDGFKPVNDSFGHRSGDGVLEQVGLRLRALAKGDDVTARVGGDQFLLMTTAFGERDAAAGLAGRVISALSRPYKVDDREVAISCSIGIALYPDQCVPAKLIARADAAMLAAKRAGGSRHCFYAPEMDADVQRDFDMLAELRKALVADQLELHFQPKIDVRSGKVTAAEALIRWRHPTHGLVSPASFLPLAERSGLIGPLGDWMIEAACKQARAWRDKGLRMRVAINLSAHQMRQEDIADRIAQAMQRHRIQPSLITCEITESAAMENTAATQETFRRLGELGAHLSIDDFGTGYSSLSYLRQLPAEELKIDASFVKDVDSSTDARAIVDAVVKLAHALGLKVVAEGVETLRQQKALVELGVDELQGYLFAKPMTARALLMWAMDDRAVSAVFRASLFGETRTATRGSSTIQALTRS